MSFAAALFALTITVVVPASEPVKVVFDTDMYTDYDDIGALAMLHAMADAGEADLLAVLQNTRGNSGLAVVEIINRYYGRPDLPVGCVRGIGVQGTGANGFGLLEKYAGWYRHLDNQTAPDAVEVYRRTLAAQPDGSVVVCSVGYLSNLRLLLESQGDAFSPLDGQSLVARKVKKTVIMACSHPNGNEHNSAGDWQSSKIVFEQWPTPIVFVDYQYGRNLYAGRAVAESAGEWNPVKDVFKDRLTPRDKVTASSYDQLGGHPSWDEAAVLAAVRDLSRYFNTERGTFRMVGTNGDDEWVADAASPNVRVTVKMPKEDVGKVIDELMTRPPRTSR